MTLRQFGVTALTSLTLVGSALAQPQELVSNSRNETPSRHGLAAMSFDLNAAALSRGASELQLQLPGGPQALLRRNTFHSRGPNAGLWRGKANLRNDSEVLLTLRNGFLAGTIQLGTDLYELRPQGSRHIVEKLNIASFPACGGSRAAGDTGTQAAQTETAGTTTAAADGVTVDLLSVYTPQARIAAGGAAQIEALIQSAVDRSNLSFSNSLVGASFRLVHAAEVAHDDAGNLDTDLTWVRNDPTVASLRNTYGADLVSLVVENGAGFCGLGYVMRSVGSGFASNAFQVTARSCAVGNLSFAHEHGHNLGMEHDPVNGGAPTSTSYPWSFGHYINGVYRTVMSYASECPNGCTRVTQFSSPNVIYSGYPTGQADRDNARTAGLTMPVAAGFRPEAATAPPVSPGSLTATVISASQINLAWADNSNNESGFRILRSTDGVSFAEIAATAASVVSYSNTGLAGSTVYTYRVVAFNAAGASNPSNDASAATPAPAPPNAPGSLTATAASSSQINLAWSDLAGNESGFRVERSTDGGVNFAVIATTAANATTYPNVGLNANTQYIYRVCAFNGDGNSAFSNLASATTPLAAPPAPAGFTGAARYSGTGKNKTLTAVALAWSDVAGNTGYNLERCKQSGKGRTLSCTFGPLTGPGADAASYLDSGVAATGTGTYQYRIRSFNAVGASAWISITVAAN